MNAKAYPEIGERVLTFQLAERLPVTIIHKKGFHRTFVTLSVPLGALNRFYIDDAGLQHRIPQGLAHFLEHKIFEQADGDISKHFTSDEAQVNAYTDHTRTTYLFSATNHVPNNTARLINMVYHPAFRAEGIEREKSVVAEEIRQYADNPYHRQYLEMLAALYHEHPIKDDILGTPESVLSIDEQMLHRVHAAYYKPEKSRLVIVGDVDADALKTALEARVRFPPDRPVHGCVVPVADMLPGSGKPLKLKQDIAAPNVLFGFAFRPESTGESRFRKQYALSIFFDLVFGKSGHYYESWLAKGWINDAYGIDIQYEPTYAHAIIMTESDHPQRFIEAFLEAVDTLGQIVLEEADFRRLKKQSVGSFVMSLDSLEYLAYESARFADEGIQIHDILDIVRTIDFEEVLQCRHDIGKKNMRCIIAYPQNDDVSKLV